MNRLSAAPVGNLLFRRLAVGWSQHHRIAADCVTAMQQTASLHYGSWRKRPPD